MSTIALAQIRIDGGTQPRARIDEALVSEYAEAMKAGTQFPAIVVFHDGVDNWLADGFHRYHAARRIEAQTILASVRTGTKRDAILHSVGANSEHGLRRTNEDKRRAVMTLLTNELVAKDENGNPHSDRGIARICAVSHDFVGHVRKSIPSLSSNDSDKPRAYTNKHGTVSVMRTENIGRGHSGTKDKRIEEIARLAKQGNNSEQIADAIGIDVRTVRQYANDGSVTLPEHITGRTRKHDNRKVIEQTVLGLEASAASLSTIGVSLVGITPEDAADWAISLADSIRAFSALRKKLQEHANAKAA